MSQPSKRPVASTSIEGLTPKSGSTRSHEYYRGVARLGVQASQALEHANERGIIHRDVKPSNLILDREGHGLAKAEMLRRGGYVLADSPDGDVPEIILIASGSEVHLALEVWSRLVGEGIACRVVNLSCWELFEKQDEEYRASVLPPSVSARLAVEAGTTFGWARYIGRRGAVLGIDRFGASAPGQVNLEEFGFHADELEKRARALL